MLLGAIVDYYTRDPMAQWVDRTVLAGIIKGGATHPKAVEEVLRLLTETPFAAEVSAANVTAMVRATLQTKAKLRLQAALEAGGDWHQALVDLQELERPAITVGITQLDAAALLKATGDRTPIYPARLNGILAGGLAPGHTMVVFGRPGSGKTLTVINLAYGFLRSGKVVLHIMNEESAEALTMRYLSLMCLSQHGSLANLAHHLVETRDLAVNHAMRIAMETAPAELAKISSDTGPRGLGNLHIVHGIYGYAQVRELVARLKPDMVIVDQVRHFGRGGDEALHQTLERVTQDLRQHAHEAGFVGVGVTQAGMSGEGKQVLDLGDIDGAKTGLQGACDVIVGVGKGPGDEAAHQRVISVCRNKISGVITQFPVWLDEQHTRLKDGPA